MRQQLIIHPWPPVFNGVSQILILGSIPSPKSREDGFYYGHPQNRFWRLLAELRGCMLPRTIEQKKQFLLFNKIALWDVLQSCIITGADDSSIRQPVVNDLSIILSRADIKAVFANGTKAAALYKKWCLPQTAIPAVPLPSSSPANCRLYNYQKLLQEYSIINNYLD